MSNYDEERLAELLAGLPPRQLRGCRRRRSFPLARAQLDELVMRAEADAAFRAQVLADLETALDAAGVEPRPAVVESLRRRLAR